MITLLVFASCFFILLVEFVFLSYSFLPLYPLIFILIELLLSSLYCYIVFYLHILKVWTLQNNCAYLRTAL